MTKNLINEPSSLLTAWLTAACLRVMELHGCSITDSRSFRVSSRAVHLLVPNIAAGLSQADRNDPDVKWAKDLGPLLIEQTVEGADARVEHNVLEVRMSDLTGSNSSARLGYMVVVGTTLFIFLTGSAHDSNLTAANPDEDRNAVVELQRLIARHLTAAGGDDFRLRWHFTEESRMARNIDHANDLLRTFSHYRVRLLLRGREYDASESADRTVLALLLSQAAADRDASVKREVRGKLSLLASNRFPEKTGFHFPFTHCEFSEERTDLVTGQQFRQIDPHRIVVDPDSPRRLKKLIKKLLVSADAAAKRGRKGVSWREIGIFAGEELGIMSRKRLREGYPTPGIHQLESPGNAVRLLLTKNIGLWRTGQFRWETWTPFRIEGLTEQLEELEIDSHGRIKVGAWLTCPQPVGGWGITEAEWDRVESLLATTSVLAGRPPSGWGYPFDSTSWTTPTGAHERRVMANSNCYEVFQRSQDQALTATGRPKGWSRRKDGEVETIGVLNGFEIRTEIGKDLGCLVEELCDTLAELDVPTSEPVDSAEMRRLRSEMRSEEEQAAKHERLAIGAHNLALMHGADDDREAARVALEEETELRKTAKGHHKRASDLRAQLEQPKIVASSETEIDVTSLELVAAGLQARWTDPNTNHENPASVPPELAEATRALHRGSFRAEPVGEHETMLRWQIDWHLPLKDGRVAVTRRTGTVKNGQQRVSAHGNPGVVAQRYLGEDLSYHDIGTEFGIDGSGKTTSLLLYTLKNWLGEPSEVDGSKRVIPTSDARRAILDAPPEVRRVIWAWKTGNDDAVTDLPKQWRRHIVEVYSDPAFAWGESWTASTWDLHRRALDYITSQPNSSQGVDLVTLQRELEAPRDLLVTLAAERQKPKPTSSPAASQPAVLNRNWKRLQREITDIDRRLIPKPCPHEDCPGIDDTGATSFASHVLYVPENPQGLLCPVCMRAPDADVAHIVFPDVYRQRWRKTVKSVDGTRSRSTTDPLPK